MTLGYADIEETVGEHLAKLVHRAACRHGRSNADYLFVGSCHLYKSLAEDILEAWGAPLGNDTFAGVDVIKTRLMPCCGIGLCRSPALALLGMYMEHVWTGHVLYAP